MPNGIAIGPLFKDWRFGWCQALDDSGRQIGDWFLIGPLALCWDWD